MNKVKNLLDKKSSLNKNIKKKIKTLNNQAEAKIEDLTEEEINLLMYQKWFGNLTDNMIQLIDNPLKNELDILKELQARYADTLGMIEKESQSIELQFEEMLSELVVTNRWMKRN